MGSALILTKGTDGVPLAHHLASCGSVVKVVFDNLNPTVLLGLTNPAVISALKMLEQYDLIIDTGSHSSDIIQAEGHSVIGGCSIGRRLVEDEQYLEKVLRLIECKHQKDADPISYFLLTGWFNGLTYSFFTITLPIDRLCEGDKGRMVGSMGRVTYSIKSDTLTKATVERVKDLLIKVKYQGPVTFSLTLTDKEVFVKHIVTTFLPIEVFELYKGKDFELLWKLKQQQPIELKDEYAICSKLIVEQANGSKLIEVDPMAFPHVCYQDLKGDCTSSLSGPVVCLVTARSPQVFEARRRVQRTIKNIIRSKDIQYRNDIGSDADMWINKIAEWEVVNAVA
jgi:hypothetical protein